MGPAMDVVAASQAAGGGASVATTVGPRLFQGVERGKFGFEMLKKMGWSEGKGLGVNENGIAMHIRIAKKQDTLGVGVAEQDKVCAWTVNTVAYDSILANLNARVTASSGASTAKSSASESDATDEDDEDVPEVTPNPRTIRERIVKPHGRYQKREKGKLVAGYSSKDLAEILGHAPGTPSVATPEVVEPVRVGGGDDDAQHSKLKKRKSKAAVVASEAEQAENDKQQKKKSKKKAAYEEAAPVETLLHDESVAAEPIQAERQQKKQKKVKLIDMPAEQPSYSVAEQASTASPPMEPEDPAQPVWWRRLFVRGGQLGAIRDPEQETGEVVRGFSEKDQEDLYTQVQNKSIAGKKGLGVDGLPKKVAGARWGGTKMTFDDDDEGTEQAGPPPQTALQEVQPDAVAAPKIKWKKLIQQALKTSQKGVMRISKLKEKVLELSAAQGIAITYSDGVEKEFLYEIERSSKFVVTGNKVALVMSVKGSE
eukprot:jgi/Chlat1/979/Chrsp108S01397